MLNNALKTATDSLLKLIEKQKFKEAEATGDLIKIQKSQDLHTE